MYSVSTEISRQISNSEDERSSGLKASRQTREQTKIAATGTAERDILRPKRSSLIGILFAAARDVTPSKVTRRARLNQLSDEAMEVLDSQS